MRYLFLLIDLFSDHFGKKNDKIIYRRQTTLRLLVVPRMSKQYFLKTFAMIKVKAMCQTEPVDRRSLTNAIYSGQSTWNFQFSLLKY